MEPQGVSFHFTFLIHFLVDLALAFLGLLFSFTA